MKNHMLTLNKLIFAILIASFHFQAKAEHQTTTSLPILIAEQLDEKGKPLPISKLNQLIFSYLESSLKLSFDVRRYPWRRVLYNGENGEGIIFGIYKTTSRMATFNFSEPVYTENVWLITRCDRQFPFKDLNDLKDKKIGIVPGSSAGEEFDKQVGKLFKNEKNDTNLAGRFAKLYQNRMDAFLLYEPRTNIKEVQKELNNQFARIALNNQKYSQEIFCILPQPVSRIDVHFAINKKVNQQFLHLIDEELIKAKKKGELDKLIAY